MTYAITSATTVPRLPSWIGSAKPDTQEDLAFLSGAALSHLHLALRNQKIPQSLLRARLALRAAEASMMRQGRAERAADLRDALAFLQPGDAPGPAGDAYLSWKRAVDRTLSIPALHRAVPRLTAEQIAVWLDAPDGAPITRAAATLEAVRRTYPRDDVAALILGNATLNQSISLPEMLPLLGLTARSVELRATGDDLRASCHRAVIAAVQLILRDAEDLTRRAQRLHMVAPKLRAKGAADAVALLLTHDAVPATAFTSLRSDRAARRFCDRLVALDAVRELTGRETFRLYGL